VKILPGQDWLHAGDLVFRRGGLEVLCLAGVPRPEILRRMFETARTALVSVREVAQRQAVSV
jgi:hypothetical protein